MSRIIPACSLALLIAFSLTAAPQAPVIPAAAQASANFDPVKATDAWLATVPAADKARSDAYFEGGYWLTLWDFLYTAALMLALLQTGLSARLRDRAELITDSAVVHWIVYWLAFLSTTFVLTFPLIAYEDFFREHSYGLSNQTFGAWFRDAMVGFAVGLVLGAPLFVAIIALVRRFPKTWPWWAALAGLVFSVFATAIAPVFIAPLFNRYTPLPASPLKSAILALAKENGIPASNVYEMDASKQSKRVSANVSGVLGTDRITLNDNLLNRCSPQAVLSVMGHEMGHYVMHHILNAMIFLIVVLVIAFAILKWALLRGLGPWGARWRVRGPDDIAALPFAVLILLILNFVFTPIGNSFTRMQEYEADIFGLNAARQPDGEAEVDLLLGEYRKLDPSPLEEAVFFDHPSGRTRIYAAMRWKAQNLCLFDPRLACAVETNTAGAQSPSVETNRNLGATTGRKQPAGRP